MSLLQGKIVVIAGGAGLLGKAFSAGVAEQGGLPIIADHDIAAATQIADALAVGGMPAVPVQLDITDSHSIDAAISSARKHGRIDGLVNGAYPRNRNWGRDVDEVRYEDFCENVSGHLGGYFLMMQKFGIEMKRNGGGSIVNLGSVYGSIAPRFSIYAGTNMTVPVEYAAIKSAIIHLSRYFAQHLKGDGVRVNTLSPGGIADSQPNSFRENYRSLAGMKGMLDAADVVGALVFLLSEQSRHVTGQNLVVDDGFSL